MASTYVNDLRLNEMATGDASGSWGTVTNTNLELIGEAFSYGTETIGDADSTLTIADGAADAARSFYLKITSSVDLTTTRIVTLAPNTVSKVWMIENATTGSQVITIKQGSGATINVPNGQVKMISTDGAGSGGAVLDLLVDVDLTGTTTLVNLNVSGAVDIAGDLTLSAGGDGALRFTAASSVKVLDNNAAALVFEEADNAYMTFVTTDGSEAVKFDKALDINAATQIDATVTVGVDDTGYDVKFFGATAGAYMLWDESADDLILGGAAGLSVNSTALVTGVLTTTAATVSNGGGQFNGAINVGVDDTGYDVKFFGATAGAYMLWDESADDLILGGAAGLSVNSAALVTGVLTANGGAVFNESGADVDFRVESDTDANALFVQGSDGFVGIGTSSPQEQIHSYAGGSNALRVSGGANNNKKVEIGYDNTNGPYIKAGSSGETGLQFYVDNTSLAATIDSSGNVGIGTSSPLSSFHVSSAGDTSITLQTTNAVDNNEIWQIQSAGNASNYADLIFRTRTNAGTGGSEAMRIDSSGNLLVGRSSNLSGARTLISGTKSGTGGTNGQLVILDQQGWSTTDNGGGISFAGEFYDGGQVVFSTIQGVKANNTDANNAGDLVFSTRPNGGNVTERMRIDASGNLLVGTTSADNGDAGFEARSDGRIFSTATSNSSFNRLSSDGAIVTFQKDTATVVGSIGVGGGSFYIGQGDTGLGFFATDNIVFPADASAHTERDNAIDLGYATGRFDDIYATNGTIQTSDRNEKQDIDVMSEAETRVAVACKGLIRKFRWIDAVAEKGDDARIHFGIIAQDLQDAFAAEGLDAGRYAMFISSTWWETQTDVPAVEAVAEVLDEEGNVVTEAVEAKEAYIRTDTFMTLEEAPEGATERTRLGVRYPELLAFIIGAL
jgi:hypothetical protein